MRLQSAFGLHDMPPMRQADDGEVDQHFLVRAVPRDRHRLCCRLEIPAAGEVIGCTFIDR
jgi:hypothetical protein